jgi:hypothetical protein
MLRPILFAVCIFCKLSAQCHELAAHSPAKAQVHNNWQLRGGQ